jgi:hypothetical protein
MTDDEFLRAFEACTFTRPEWTHEAHVRMAWLYLTRLPFVEALDRIRRGIRKLNARIGQPPVTHRAPTRPRCITARSLPASPDDPNGYHETITVALTRIIAARGRPGEEYAAFRERNPDLFDRKLPALFRHYSLTLIGSPEARGRFEEPARTDGLTHFRYTTDIGFSFVFVQNVEVHQSMKTREIDLFGRGGSPPDRCENVCAESGVARGEGGGAGRSRVGCCELRQSAG